ncbi:MAG TPA: recombinase family protein [Rhabdochlamydiaceae bacterium]
MKVALYSRVSTRDQHPEAQGRELEEFAKRSGWEYEVFEETESSRKTRPIKQNILSRLRLREFDGVLVYSLSRWARSLPELVLEVQELTDKGIKFISLKENIDLSTASGKLMFHVFAALADFERELIRERTFLGLDNARAKGKILGRPRGRKDTKIRSKSGYYLRYANCKKPSSRFSDSSQA